MGVMEEKRVEFIYPLEKISSISIFLTKNYKLPLINNFNELYDNLEFKILDISTFKKNNFKNNKQKNQLFWKRKNKFRGKDLEKFLSNAYVKQLPENNQSKIKKIIISHLNKLNDKKFTIIVKEFIDNLEELMFSETYDILNDEILNKVFQDSNYISLYSKLIKELIINKKWQRKMFNIISNNEEYYWSLNKLTSGDDDSEFVGPFSKESDALDDAIEHHNYKISFCNFIEKSFQERDTFIEEINSTIDSFDANIYAKNKYQNFIKFIFTNVEQGIFNTKILHHSLLMLLQLKELDQFVYLYQLIDENPKIKLSKEYNLFYDERVNEIIQTIRLSPKTKFKLQEYFRLQLQSSNIYDILAVESDTEEEPEKIIVKREEDRDINFILSEFPISQNYEEVKQIFKTLKIADYKGFTSKLILSILEEKNEVSTILFDLNLKLWKEFKKYGQEFKNFIEDNMINLYSEYEIDYPNSKELFKNLINEWLKLKLVDRVSFLEEIRDRYTDNEDERFNIELFNKQIISQLL